MSELEKTNQKSPKTFGAEAYERNNGPAATVHATMASRSFLESTGCLQTLLLHLAEEAQEEKADAGEIPECDRLQLHCTFDEDGACVLATHGLPRALHGRDATVRVELEGGSVASIDGALNWTVCFSTTMKTNFSYWTLKPATRQPTLYVDSTSRRVGKTHGWAYDSYATQVRAVVAKLNAQMEIEPGTGRVRLWRNGPWIVPLEKQPRAETVWQ